MSEPARSWLTAAASVIGTSHIARGAPCQDRYRVQVVDDVEGTPVLVVAVADGAGSAARSEYGAKIAVDTFVERTSAVLAACPHRHLVPADARNRLHEIREGIRLAADNDKVATSAYACTFAGVVAGPAKCLVLQIGDAIIATRFAADDGWRLAARQQKGEYRNETRFVTTADGETRAFAAEFGAGLEQVAVASDGIEDLCIDKAAQAAYGPFFESLADTLIGTGEQAGASPNDALARYLASETVNAVTDDDKTLVFAVLRPLG